MILNALSNDFITSGFNQLRVAGRFVEIGKRDIWCVEQARAWRLDVSFVCFDETTMFELHRHVLHRSLETNVRVGIYCPLPFQGFTLGDCGSAYTFLRLAVHVGKVITMLTPEIQIAPSLCIKSACNKS